MVDHPEGFLDQQRGLVAHGTRRSRIGVQVGQVRSSLAGNAGQLGGAFARKLRSPWKDFVEPSVVKSLGDEVHPPLGEWITAVHGGALGGVAHELVAQQERYGRPGRWSEQAWRKN